ncbi:GPI transamidase component PIG-S [Neolecta irregularis DAH-3]|uniref:GPI transamidase component PIG-S n=1 Tax=Neolecta irregularis (strain DAH-3) TaxID=1198029 RepID=A0A1U7LL35_NEOID|nr:GPI transamidase component PIG-S [Neolecta irregularis DAH-3]|eukprot:OLL23303.1 GPI transamidase component PIG-S [Neolecta irregularis DAH-3]
MASDSNNLPPESATRRKVVFSFWAVIIVGVPLWWITTRIYRANLPLETMKQWSLGKVCSVEFPISVAVSSFDSTLDLESLIRNAQHQIDDSNEFNSHHLRLHSRPDSHESLKLEEYSVLLFPDPTLSEPTINFHDHNRTLSIWYPLSSKGALKQYISSNLLNLFSSERIIVRDILAQDTSAQNIRVLKYSSTFGVTFSLMNAEGDGLIQSWDIEDAERSYLQPLIHQLSVVSNFTVDSQIQYYTTSSFEPRSFGDHWELSIDEIPGFINSAEWTLATPISDYPSINFIVYVPSPKYRPLIIKDRSNNPVPSNAFLVPQWGGILIHNPISDSTHLSKDEMKPIFSTFISQFLSLLGVPASHSPSASSLLSPKSLDGLIRLRTAENLVSAAGTMGSLARLVRQIGNMAVPERVREDVEHSILFLEKTCWALHSSQFTLALEFSRAAHKAAEKAFFDPTMVSMLYFPNEHKYAIYTPLFGPLVFPLLTALITELKIWRANRKLKTT